METTSKRYEEHLGRIKKAIALEKPDRIPFLAIGDVFFLKYADPSATVSDYFERTEWAHEKEFEGILKLGDIDAVSLCGVYLPMIAVMWMGRLKIPGRDLPKDDMYQIVEPGTMTEEDYDIIIDKGWFHFVMEFMTKRLDFDVASEIGKAMACFMTAQKRLAEAGIVSMAAGGALGAPFDALSSARSIPKFMRDLYRIPEKVKAALDVAREELTAALRAQIRDSKLGVVSMQPAVRAQMLPPKMFEKIAWPLFKGLTDAAIDEGADVLLHMDSNWDHLLEFFRDFPKGKCIFDPDGTTDIYKIKEVLGDRMCITGDVPATLLSMGTPDEVYKYCKKLINEIGPSGFIMASGCSTPANAKPENVEAMVASAFDS